VLSKKAHDRIVAVAKTYNNYTDLFDHVAAYFPPFINFHIYRYANGKYCVDYDIGKTIAHIEQNDCLQEYILFNNGELLPQKLVEKNVIEALPKITTKIAF